MHYSPFQYRDVPLEASDSTPKSTSFHARRTDIPQFQHPCEHFQKSQLYNQAQYVCRHAHGSTTTHLYPTTSASLTAASSISLKTFLFATTTGASSMIFWCLRWIEQSRPNKEIAVPSSSANNCTSKWRAFWANFIRKIGDPGTSN